MNNAFSKAAIWVVIALVLFTVFRQFDTRQGRAGDVPYSQFMKEAESGRIESVQIDGRTLRARTRDGQAVTVFTPGAGDLWMVSDLLKVDKSKVTAETSFSDLGADSLDMVELLMTIEDTFEPFGELKIPEEDANISTVGEAVERIDSYITDYIKE